MWDFNKNWQQIHMYNVSLRSGSEQPESKKCFQYKRVVRNSVTSLFLSGTWSVKESLRNCLTLQESEAKVENSDRLKCVFEILLQNMSKNCNV